jgi:formylglycine-generating enzyme required for sulfatase activity
MGGNVWEWCEDLYQSGSSSRVLRGASWLDFNPDRLASSYRGLDRPTARYTLYGFRVVLVVGGGASSSR